MPSNQPVLRIIAAIALAVGARSTCRGEDLSEAWRIAVSVDQRLEATRHSAEAAGHDLKSSKAARLPQIQTVNTPTFLTNSIFPSTAAAGGAGKGGGTNNMFMLSAVAGTVPLYTGGRILNTIDQNRAEVNAARAEETSTTLDLKFDVAQAYIGVLRSGRSVAVARSNVVSLAAQTRDVDNLVKNGRGIRNDLLAARTALANARQREIQVRNNLDLAWATYNRYLCRPMNTVVPLEDLAVDLVRTMPLPTDDEALKLETDPTAERAAPVNEPELRRLIDVAFRNRSELAGLSEQARAQFSQSAAERAATRPQASFIVANIYQNTRILPVQDFGVASFLVAWTPFDGGRSRQRSLATERRGAATKSRQADLAASIALEVRSAWLNLDETRRRIPVTRSAIEQAEENLRVARSRYIQQRGTNTEVLDAETLRIQSYDNYYNALYDSILADFRLRRAIGEL